MTKVTALRKKTRIFCALLGFIFIQLVLKVHSRRTQ